MRVTDHDTTATKQALERNITALNARDIDAYLANQRPNVEFVLPGGVILRGRDELRSYTEALWEAFPDGKLTFGDQVLAAGSAATEVTFTGTHTGPMTMPDGQLPPTGRLVTLRSASLLRFENGQVASEHVFLDQLEMLNQLGIGEPG
jgi:predicted ester cyclase